MVTAQGAHMNTVDALKAKTEPILKQIEEKILKEAAEGEFETYYAETVTTEVIDKLRAMGYKVKVVSSDIDDYGNFYPGFIRIDWKSYDGKGNFFKRISARIKSITY